MFVPITLSKTYAVAWRTRSPIWPCPNRGISGRPSIDRAGQCERAPIVYSLVGDGYDASAYSNRESDDDVLSRVASSPKALQLCLRTTTTEVVYYQTRRTLLLWSVGWKWAVAEPESFRKRGWFPRYSNAVPFDPVVLNVYASVVRGRLSKTHTGTPSRRPL